MLQRTSLTLKLISLNKKLSHIFFMKTPQVFSPIQFCEKKTLHGENPAGNFVFALEASNDDKLLHLHSVLFV